MRLPIAALALAALAAPAAHAQLFKCVKDGRTVYQDAPCDDAARQSTIRAPSPGAAPRPAAEGKAAPAAAAAAPPAAAANAAEIVAGFAACSEKVPNFAYKYTTAYEGWKARNGAALGRLANEPDASQLDARMRQERERPADEAFFDHCAGVATSIQPPQERGMPKVVGQ
jgi:hypothetical protein